MRSRYTAHVLSQVDYIKETLVAKARNDFDAAATQRWAQESKWKGLEIKSVEQGGPKDDTGTVEFVASYERKGSQYEHHEVSTFRKNSKGRWEFVEGDAHEHKDGEGHHHHAKVETVVRDKAKIGRNDPCHCGSGKKLKKCCG